MTVDAFLSRHPEFSLIPVADAVASVTSDGVRFPECNAEGIELCRRFYPHRSRGEGQFIALMKKNTSDTPSYSFKDKPLAPSKDEEAAVRSFFRENLTAWPDAKLIKYGNNLVLIAHGCPLPTHSVFSAGVLVGEVRGKLLFPSHQLFTAYGELFKNRAELSEEDAKRYIAGEETDAPEGCSGYLAVTYRGATLGGGKASGGKIKNHFPKGLRVR